MTNTTLIMGASGFIGSNLSKRLLKEGHKLICIDNLYTGKTRKHLMDNPNFKFINHNIIEPLIIGEKIDEIYNLVSQASPPHYQKDRIFIIKTNFIEYLIC